jgi:hypothetical protein
MKKFILVFLILGIIVVGVKYIPTEGVRILYHYMFGDGSDLELNSDYIPQSTVIVSRLKKMNVGETRKISFKQSEDWRLSYAINGFSLTKTANGFNINQYIQFDRTGKIYTIINLYLVSSSSKCNTRYITPSGIRFATLHYSPKGVEPIIYLCITTWKRYIISSHVNKGTS